MIDLPAICVLFLLTMLLLRTLWLWAARLHNAERDESKWFD